MSSDFLEQMAAVSRERADEARHHRQEFERVIATQAAAPALKFSPAGFDIIAEFKRRSPALGALGGDDLRARLAGYVSGGAVAISILTEPTRFDGSMADLSRAADLLSPHGVPVMRKDFLVDPIQLFEARAAGASGVLLILRLLNDRALANMFAVARELDLFVLAEAFDRDDLRRLATAGISQGEVLAGLNSRDLKNLEVQPHRFFELAGAFPDELPMVAESGIDDGAMLGRLAAAGYRVALIGGALMRNASPGPLLASWLAEARDLAKPKDQ